MISKDEAKMLDRVLKSFVDSTGGTTELLALNLGIGRKTSAFYCEKLADSDFLKLMPVSGKGLASHQEYIATITNKGYNFLVHEGGYTKLYVRDLRVQIWQVVKIIAGATNALAVIFLSYLTYENQREKDIKEIQIQQQKLIIESEEAKVRMLGLRLSAQKRISDSLLAKKQVELEQTIREGERRIKVLEQGSFR